MVGFQRAVSRVMPPDTQSFHPRNDPDVMIVEEDTDIPPVPPSAFKPVTSDKTVDRMDIGNHIGHPPAKRREFSSNSSLDKSYAAASTSSGPSGASTGPKFLNFTVKYCDRVLKITLPDSADLSEFLVLFAFDMLIRIENFKGDLKQRIQAEVNVAPCRQNLSGWARLADYEKTSFKLLQLPQDNELVLTIKSHADGVTAENE